MTTFFHFCADESSALARFDVQEIDYGHDFVVIEERNALSQIACHNLCHNDILLNMCFVLCAKALYKYFSTLYASMQVLRKN